jgi:hypothetical protein
VPEDAELGIALNRLGVCYTALDRWSEALPCFEQASTVLAAHLPADAPLLGTVRQNVEIARSKVPLTGPQPDTTPGVASTTGSVRLAEAQNLGADAGGSAASADAPPLVRLAISAILAFAIGLFISRRAWQRGYGSLTWFMAFLLSCSTPILTACVLATLPDRRRQRRREELQRWLEQELTTAGTMPTATASALATSGSIGDAPTQT